MKFQTEFSFKSFEPETVVFDFYKRVIPFQVYTATIHPFRFCSTSLQNMSLNICNNVWINDPCHHVCIDGITEKYAPPPSDKIIFVICLYVTDNVEDKLALPPLYVCMYVLYVCMYVYTPMGDQRIVLRHQKLREYFRENLRKFRP